MFTTDISPDLAWRRSGTRPATKLSSHRLWNTMARTSNQPGTMRAGSSSGIIRSRLNPTPLTGYVLLTAEKASPGRGCLAS
jgi:hypothetical protein